MTRLGVWLRYRRRLARLFAEIADSGYLMTPETYDRLREQARRIPPPGSLQLDLLSAILRLEQLQAERLAGRDGEFYVWRLLTCDLPRLHGHLTEETKAWHALADDELAARRPR